MKTDIKTLLEFAGVDITQGKAKQLVEMHNDLPSRFKSGNDFMEFVYDRFPSRKTHVEHQGGGAWSADIDGHDVIKGATFDEKTGYVSWTDANYEELSHL